ncbi:MAG: amidase [Proteobacteria bacterium]|nr:amidase [Pseudomonadota bacterium]
MTRSILDLSAGAIAAAIRTRTLSAAEVIAAALARIEEVDGAVNAVCTVNPKAMDEARALDRRLAGGAPARPLEGVPVLVKDIIETKGIRTAFGSIIMHDFVPDEDAIVVERLKAAGAIVLGKTNTPEFATSAETVNRVFGATRNPWDLNRSPSGSSGGTAAGIAAGYAPVGLGTDLGGSIRKPAAFCGIAGLRPCQGRVPIYPQDYAWDTLVPHVDGPMAQGVADIGLMLKVLAGPDDRDPSSLPAPVHDYVEAASGRHTVADRRIAYSADMGGLVPVDPEVAEITRRAAAEFEAMGCRVAEDCFDTGGLNDIVSGTRAFNMVARYADRYDAHKAVMTNSLVKQVESSLKYDLRTVTRAERMRTRYWHRVRKFMERYDYIVTPTMSVAAYRIDGPLPTELAGVKLARFYDALVVTYAFTVTGLPVISIPCGFTAAGLPVGLQIAGPRLREDMVIEAAAAYAARRPEHFRRPEIRLIEPNPVHESFDTPSSRIG